MTLYKNNLTVQSFNCSINTFKKHTIQQQQIIVTIIPPRSIPCSDNGIFSMHVL